MESVIIKTNGKVKFGNRHVKVKKSPGEEVLFVAKRDGGPWKVVFDKAERSPFPSDSIDVPQGSYKRSGKPTDSSELGKKYRYSVYDGSGKKKDDPDVEIE